MAARIDNGFVAPSRTPGSDFLGPRPDFSQLAADVKKLVAKLTPEQQHVAKQMESSLLKAMGLGAKSPQASTDSFDSGPRRF